MKSKILLVEDDEEIVQILQELIDPDEFELTSSTCSQKACQILGQRKFDILICDLFMPQLTGLSLLQICQKNGHLPQTVVVVSAYLGNEDFAHGFLKQFHCLEKPFFIPELLKIISLQREKDVKPLVH